MSRPRAATSVATRTRISPVLNSSRARVRSGCERSRVDRDRVDPGPVEPGREARGRQLRPGEDQHLLQVLGPDEVGEQLFLAVAVDRVDELADRVDRGVLRGATWTSTGIAQDRLRQAPDVVGERRREHQVLALGRQQGEDLLDVGQEAHVEHPVGLVEDEDLDLAEVRDPLADEVEQAARRRDEDLDPAAEGLDLGIHRDAAVDDRRAERDRAAVGPDALVDLHRELARRDEDQDADRVAGRRERGVRVLRSRSRIGSVKAAVLPVPVWAAARTSRPWRTRGMAWAWTGVGVCVALLR